MSLQTVMYVLDRLCKEPSLFSRYMSDPYGTLAGFDLTAEELEAIVSGEREQLIAVGLDERIAGWILRPSRHRRDEQSGGRAS